VTSNPVLKGLHLASPVLQHRLLVLTLAAYRSFLVLVRSASKRPISEKSWDSCALLDVALKSADLVRGSLMVDEELCRRKCSTGC